MSHVDSALTFVQVDVCKLMSHERFIRLSTSFQLGLRKIMKARSLEAPENPGQDVQKDLKGVKILGQDVRGC